MSRFFLTLGAGPGSALGIMSEEQAGAVDGMMEVLAEVTPNEPEWMVGLPRDAASAAVRIDCG